MKGKSLKMMKKIVLPKAPFRDGCPPWRACILAFLILFVAQTAFLTHSNGETKDAPLNEVKETKPPGLSEREFFVAVKFSEYNEFTDKGVQLYNEDKYPESMEISKKVLDLYNERYEEIKKGCEKYGVTKDAQKKFECFPIFQYATAAYAEASVTEHKAHTMPERFFLLLKAKKLFKYTSAMYPNDYRQETYYSTTSRLFYNAASKSNFTEEEAKPYNDLIDSYDFAKEELRTLKNAVEFIDKVDKLAKEYKPKAEVPQPEHAKASAGEKVSGLEVPATEK